VIRGYIEYISTSVRKCQTQIVDSMERLRKKLSEYDQEHLLRFWEELIDEDKNQLENDIDELELQEIMGYFKRAVEFSWRIGQSTLDDKIQPIDEMKIASAKTSTEEDMNMYKERGLKEIAEGCVAVLLLAGGQGTRLGVTYPKGIYDVELPSHKTLFQLQAERILCLQNMAQQQYGKHGEITWYLCNQESLYINVTYDKEKKKYRFNFIFQVYPY